jgi:hypothetical protein
MSVFIRRFGFDPGEDVLLEIESVNILDLDPPASITGVGTGTVICVGEFENGPFAAQAGVAEMPKGVYEVAGANDFIQTAGSFGYTYGGITANNPCARQRSADSAITPEAWNGNGFIQLSGKKFKRLLIARVDTSVGSVTFSRQAYVTGAAEFTYSLAPSQVVAVADSSGSTYTATFSAAAASVLSGNGTYNTGFTGGETLTLSVDAQPAFTVTFLSGDQSKAQVISRINLYAGFTFASDGGGSKIQLTGITKGKAGQITVVSGSGSVLTTLGLSAAQTFGTGDVNDITAVSFQEVKAKLEANLTGFQVTLDNNGALRLKKTWASNDDWFQVTSSTTASGLGFTVGEFASNSGFAYIRSGSGTYPAAPSTGDTLILGNDDLPNFTVVFQSTDTSIALTIARINQFAGYAMASEIDSTHIQLIGAKNGGQVRVIGGTSTVLTALGFVAGTTIQADFLNSGLIPAGTVVQTSDGTKQYVTMQDVNVTVPKNSQVPSGPGPYPVKVRPALDDGSGASSNAGTVNTVGRPIDLASFSVTNLQTVSAAMTEAAIDSAYSDAFDATVDINSVAKDCNIIFAARQSNTVRKLVRTNVNLASSTGSLGRMGCVRPPLNTAKSVAYSKTDVRGVAATRDQRVIYCYPGFNTFVPLMAKRGLAGGAGFTVDGNLDIGSDGFMASILSQLPPEENPGQLTAFTTAVNSLETGTNAQGFQMKDYTAFRGAGIAAARMDDGTAIFQSGVTSVDPQVFPELRNIARRRMADFIQDTLARRGKAFGKKLSTFVRRKAYANECSQFLESLLSRNNPASQRIAGYTVDRKSGNTQRTLGLGLYRLIIKVRTLASLDSIVLETTIGEQVEVEEQLPANAA